MTPKNQRAQKFGAKYAAQNGGVHIATLVSIIILIQVLGFKCTVKLRVLTRLV
jgi:hypothetical protein